MRLAYCTRMTARGRNHGRTQRIPAVSSYHFSRRIGKAGARGVTLVELMVVVVIAGLLAMVGIGAMRKHLEASRSSEALAMIQSIRAAEERYRAVRMIYLNVSTPGSAGWYPRDPRPGGAGHGDVRVPFFTPAGTATHTDNANWLRLAPTVSGPVQFAYRVNAGLPGQTITTPEETVPGLTWSNPSEPWYVVQGIADGDTDGTTAYFLASSLTDAVYIAREGE